MLPERFQAAFGNGRNDNGWIIIIDADVGDTNTISTINGCVTKWGTVRSFQVMMMVMGAFLLVVLITGEMTAILFMAKVA